MADLTLEPSSTSVPRSTTMRSHNPKRLIVTAVAVAAITGAALLPGIASADGGAKPRPQGAPLIGTTYGGSGQLGVYEKSFETEIRQPARPTPKVVDAADYVI